MTEKINDCCPVFKPEKWNEKTFKWEKKKFIKSWVPAFFHIPSTRQLGKKIPQLMKLAEEAGALNDREEDILLLFSDPNPFKSEFYLSVEEGVEGAQNTSLNGTFISKVFDGPYKAIPRFIKEMNTYLSDKEEKARRFFIHYAYCPKCAESVGHNHMVIFAQVNA